IVTGFGNDGLTFVLVGPTGVQVLVVIVFGGLTGLIGFLEIFIFEFCEVLVEFLDVLVVNEFVINDFVSHGFLRNARESGGRMRCSGIAAGGYYVRRPSSTRLHARNVPHPSTGCPAGSNQVGRCRRDSARRSASRRSKPGSGLWSTCTIAAAIAR